MGLTTAAGVFLPILALYLSHAAGKLFEAGQYALALWALALCCSVLFVSMPHLAWAIADITKSPPWPSWALALAIDMTLVLCEAIFVKAPLVISNWVVTSAMVGVILASMVLNCWAFLKKPGERKE